MVSFLFRFRPIIILGAAALVGYFLIAFSKKPEPLLRTETAWPVKVRKIAKTQISSNTIVFGQIESQQEASLRSTVAGNIISTPGKEGLFVAKNDLIVQIDPIETKLEVQKKAAEVQKIKAEIRAEKTRYEADTKILIDQKRLIDLLETSVTREKKLKSQLVGSQARIDVAEQASVRDSISLIERQFSIDNYKNREQVLEAQLSRAQAELKLSELDLTRTAIIAPFSGRISQRFIAIGDRVQPNQAILSMYDTAKLEIRAEFPITAIPTLQSALDNQEIITGTIADLETELDIKLDRIAGKISKTQGGIDALFLINHENPPLRIGQTIKLIVAYPKLDNVFSVPQTALYDTESGFVLYKIVQDDAIYRLQSLPVKKVGDKIRLDGENEVIIFSNEIYDKDSVLMTRLPYARDGLKVTPSE